MARLYGPNRQHQGQQGKQAIKGQIQQNPIGLKANLVERAIKLSHDKYCSATAMLAKTANIKIDWTIKEVD